MRGGSLCTGGGGLDLGLESVLDVEWAWHCEPDAACGRVLEARWPGVPNLGDLFSVEWETVEPVELLSAGFPCPDYSLAGSRKGIDGEHGQVWYGVAAAVRALRPAYLVLENVAAIRTAAGPLLGDAGVTALGVVLADLAEVGYRWAYDCLRAADVGAPHGRDRWFCVARLAADAVGGGVDADRRVRGGDAGAPRRPARAAVPAGPEVARAEDALPDRAGAAAADGGRGGSAPADAGGVARSAPGELDGGPGAGGEPSARGEAWAEERRAAGRDRGGGTAAADPDGGRREVGGEPEPRGVEGAPGGEPDGRDPLRGLGDAAAATDAAGRGRDGWPPGEGVDAPGRRAPVGAEGDADARDGGRAPRGADGDAVRGTAPGRAAAADADDAGRGEHGGAVAARAELGAAERGRGEAPADADGGGRAGVGRGAEPGGGQAGDAPRYGAEDLGDAAAADAGRESGEPGERRRAAGGADARGGTPERDGDGQPRPTEPGAPEPSPADADERGLEAGPDGAQGGEPDAPRSADRGNGGRAGEARASAASDADGVGRREGEQGAEVRDGIADALVGGERPAVEWGVYEPAVRRWEQALGRAAPAPTDARGRLSPAFVEWMLGYPAGWISDVPDVPRTAQLRILGNSVQVQCAERVAFWLADLVEAGLLV